MSTRLLTFAEFCAHPLTESQQDVPGSSTIFEYYVVTAWNAILEKRERYLDKSGTVKTGVRFPAGSGYNTTQHNTYALPAFMIANELLTETKSKQRLIRSEGDDYPITDLYRQWGGVNRTPKTDVYTADKKYRWSMKINTGSVLMSGGHSDVFPTFKIAESEWRKKSEAQIVLRLGKALDSVLTNIKPPPEAAQYIDVKRKTGGKGGRPGFGDAALSPALRKKFPPAVNKFLDEILFRDADIKGKLNDELQQMFNDASRFREHFVYEAASGAGKFGKLAPVAVANEFMKWSLDGLVVREPFPEGATSPVIKKLAGQVAFRLRWKHGTKIRLAVDIFKDHREIRPPVTYQDLLERHLRTYPLTEGLMDWSKAQWSSFSSWVTTFVAAVLAEVKRLVSKGLDAVYQFFGMELDIVELTSVPVITL